MSEPDELSEQQLAELIGDLHALRASLLDSLGQRDRQATVDLDLPIGRVSRIDAIQQQKMAQAEERRNKQRLEQVTAALEFVDEDEYGLCKVCGEWIPFKRLKARPETAFCVPCMSKLERG